MSESSGNFIRSIIEKDIIKGKNSARVHTRFPPEPNGYLHIGHAKSICLNFGLATSYKGKCNLRFDDTNPSKEDVTYVESIKEDVRWLGFDWEDREYYASDYYAKLYDLAIGLLEKGKAFVCDLDAIEIRQFRGTLTEPGRDSPCRERSVSENLTLFQQMRDGQFPDGSKTLRAKIDMASPNLNLRDPVMYRILRISHHRTGDHWCIYPTYDWAHGQSDSIEGITHSICTLEFEDHRPLYDWFLDQLGIFHPQQIEFARLNLNHTVMSKRKLLELVEGGHVSGWNDPRMPTIAGMRRRGYTPESIRDFSEKIGISKSNSTVDIGLLEHCVRENLNLRAPRVMAVLRPLKVTISNYPEGKVEYLKAENNPEDPNAGFREIPFSREIFIERDDFRENPPRKYFRLSPGREIRLKHAYYITCTYIIKDKESGEIIELICSYDPQTRGGWSQDGRKVRGTSHWVTVSHAIPAEVHLYNHLFRSEFPEDAGPGGDFKDDLNPESLEILTDCRVESSLSEAEPGQRFQFLRQGYFCLDSLDSKTGKLVFNRTVSLRDTWAKIEKKLKQT